MAKKRYRVLTPQYWINNYAPDPPPHPFGIAFVTARGERRRYESGEMFDDLPAVADAAELVALGYIEEVV